MKNILFAIAMKREAAIICDEMKNIEEKIINGFTFKIGEINNNKIIIGISGVGIINMSSMITTAMNNFDVDYVYNYGMIGGYGKNIHKDDLVLVSDVLNIGSYITEKISNEDDITNFEYKYNYITFTDDGEEKFTTYKCDKEMLEKAKLINYDKTNIHVGRIGSSDEWNNEFDKIVSLLTEHKLLGEDMECVAIYQLAERFGYKVLSVKGVSDNIILNESYDDSVLPILKEFLLKLINE